MGLFKRESAARKRMSVDERAKARKSVAVARAQFKKARTEARLEANEYARDEEGELELQGKLSQLASSTAWYFFWQKSNKMPKQLEMWNGEVLTWEDASVSCLEEVLEAAAEKRGRSNWTEPKKLFWLKDVQYESSATRSKNGLVYVRVKATLNVPPRVLLLTQIRAESRGEADPSLIYLREHYKFRFGRTQLFHSITEPPARMCAPRDYCDLVSWDEYPDGRITVAEESVLNCVPKRAIRGSVRGVTRVRGMVIEPTEIETTSFLGGKTTVVGSQVTMVACVDPRGWFPKGLFNMALKTQCGQFLLNCERVGQALIANGQADVLIKRHVLRQLEAEDETTKESA